jgi:hypothetical protein
MMMLFAFLLSQQFSGGWLALPPAYSSRCSSLSQASILSLTSISVACVRCIPRRWLFCLWRQRLVCDQPIMSCSAPAAPACGVGLGHVHLLGLSAVYRDGSAWLPVLGVTQGKEYAEPEWYADLWLTVVWVAYLLVFPGHTDSSVKSRIFMSLTGSIWLLFITVAILHLGNNVNVPVELFGAKSYTVASGVQSAMIQWWYGHNAVGFFLTAGFLGMMYYFVPKQASVRFILIACRFCTSGRSSSSTSGLARTICTTRHCRTGRRPGHDLLDHAVDAVLGWHD